MLLVTKTRTFLQIPCKVPVLGWIFPKHFISRMPLDVASHGWLDGLSHRLASQDIIQRGPQILACTRAALVEWSCKLAVLLVLC